MRLHILSDLHLEFGGAWIGAVEADVVVLAGDIHMGREGLKWIRATFEERPVVYVLGNHEFYRHLLPELTETLKRECEGSNIHVLEDSSVVLDGYRFLGCTLWTDFAVKGNPQAAMRVAEQMMSDYRLIRNSKEGRNLRASDTVVIHRRSRKWLEGELSKGDNAKSIVVTHAAPSMRSEASYHQDSPIAPAFSSDMDELVEGSRVPLWVHGHTHYNVDYKIGGTRVLSNQRGYPEEVCEGFDAGMVVGV